MVQGLKERLAIGITRSLTISPKREKNDDDSFDEEEEIESSRGKFRIHSTLNQAHSSSSLLGD
jgi:hypothetical protein